MNSSNNNKNSNRCRNNKRENNQSQRGGKRQRNGWRSNNRDQTKPWSDKAQRQFPKFADTDYHNTSTYRNCDDRSGNNYAGEGSSGPGIFSWVRDTPVKPLMIPHHTHFEQQQHVCQDKTPSTKTVNNKPTEPETFRNNSIPPINPVSESTETSKLPPETNVPVKIKQEKDLLTNLKQEKASSSSPSSSSSESSSSEEESVVKTTKAEKAGTTSCKPPSSQLNIKLKPNPINSTPINISQTLDSLRKAPPTSSSTSTPSSSSSSSDEQPEPSSKKTEKLECNKKETNTKSSKTKISSEDDVVCIGKVENKIVLDDEDESDSSCEEKAKTSNKKPKKSSKKIKAVKCMICDKKGHTSFQCQMICKNCSAPYHGYRTCPQPVNLNTMLQLFIEFCMKQLQNFNSTNPFHNATKHQTDSTHLNVSNKSNKIKRKAKENNIKSKASKKLKISNSGGKKNKSKIGSDDNTDDDKDEDNTDSDTSSTGQEEEDISDSSAVSVVSSKRKRKMKSKSDSKPSLNLPVVLNGFPNLTVPSVSIPNPCTSSNALNTLLLTQMFQNAIGSLQK